jgi:hypothetical protein
MRIRHALHLLFVLVVAGCGSSSKTTAPGSSSLLATRDVSTLFAQMQGKNAHPYFSLVPGAYKDYRITLAGEAQPRFIRVTVGLPESFFNRMATPLVYSAIPGQIPDTVIVGLRQYFSIAPDGALWFHGAQNGIVRAHSDPPVRNLLAKPSPGEAWSDTVLFESYIGGALFLQDHYIYDWKLSEVARLDLPAGSFKAVRATQTIQFVDPSLRVGGLSEMVRAGVALKPGPVDILKGYWFAKHEGIVAKDWPFGEGEVNANVATYELIAEGAGPIPPPFVPPPPGGTQ